MNDELRTVFFGNTKYSLIGLEILHSKLGVSFLVTIERNPTQFFAIKNSIPFMTTKKLTPEVVEKIKNLSPDFFVVEDYGLILPENLLAVPKIAALNIHHSLLPKYRGPSPAPSAILSGENITGVSIIKMTNKVDAGDILEQKEYSLSNDDTTETVLTALNKIGGDLAVAVIKTYKEHERNAKKQDESKATFTSFMKKEDGKIDLNSPPSPMVLDRMVRAYFPWPSVWTRAKLGGKEKIIKLLPNTLISQHPDSPFLIQVEGKTPMSYKDFTNGYKEGKEILEKLKP